MKNKKITTAQTALNFGLILGGTNILYGIMLFALDMHYQNDTATSIIGYAFLIGIILWGIMRFKKINGGYLRLSKP